MKIQPKSLLFIDFHFTLVEPRRSYGQNYYEIAKLLDIEINPDDVSGIFKDTWEAISDKVIAAQFFFMTTQKETDEWWAHFHSCVILRISKSLCSKEQSLEFGRRFHSCFVGDPDFFSPVSGVFETLDTLRSQGHTLILMSNGNNGTRSVISSLGFDPYFKPILISGEIGYSKPNPRVFGDLIENKETAWIIGDSENFDIQAGKNAGIHTCLIGKADSVSSADIVIEKFSEIINFTL